MGGTLSPPGCRGRCRRTRRYAMFCLSFPNSTPSKISHRHLPLPFAVAPILLPPVPLYLAPTHNNTNTPNHRFHTHPVPPKHAPVHPPTLPFPPAQVSIPPRSLPTKHAYPTSTTGART